MGSGSIDDEAWRAGGPRHARLRDIVNATILDALPSAVALLDEHGVVRSVNAAWVRSALRRPDDPLIAEPGTDYRTVLDAVGADPACRSLVDAVRAVLDGTVEQVSADHPPEATDTSEWFTVRAVGVDADGGGRSTVIAIEDVSALRHAVDRWHSTFSDAAVPTILLDEHGTIVDANAAFAELLRTDVAATVRQPAREIVHPDDQEVTRDRIARAVVGDRDTEPLEIRLLRADGTVATVEVRPAQLAPGKRPAVVQLLDITQQRLAERRLALQRELLELVASGAPLADVAAAVALNVGRAVEGATGAVVLAGSAPFLPPGAPGDALRAGWSVPVDRARAAVGDVVVVPSRPAALPEPDELDAAEMLASIVRLALQRDELAAFVHASASTDAADVRGALDRGELVVHYQPIVDLVTGATKSIEALVRWSHPARGAVAPSELLHVAEASGFVAELSSFVLTRACADLAMLRAAGSADLAVAVNLSGRELAEPTIVDVVAAALDGADLAPDALAIEITESVLVDDVDVVAGALTALRARGVRVAIDDFGTGYSSLLYLKRFPADVLKLDRSFVQGLGANERDTAIVDAVVGLGHRLGLEVVAEGVETARQLDELRRRRCDHAQGYLLQRPVPPDELRTFLAAGTVALGSELPAAPPQHDLAADELLSIVTHELSTPLAVIGGHAELLADRMRGTDDVDAADAIERSISNLDDLLRTLSTMGQALGSAGARSTIDLVPFVEQAVRDLSPLLARHDVRVESPEDTAFAAVEPVAVRQVITNVLSNAAKFTALGTRVDVVVRPGAVAHEVVVADHGPGIPADREQELFERYARLGATARGLGLGLHLARTLARRQGGDLRHEPTPGGGATFVLEVPA